MDKLTGQIITQKTISGNVQVVSKIPFPVHDKYEEYEGAYNVIPRKVQQTLPTKQRSMEEDLTVDAINYLEVANPQGGKTVTIGFE